MEKPASPKDRLEGLWPSNGGKTRQGAWFVYTLWHWHPFVEANENVKYHIRGSLEHCPETGKPHLHGVATLWKKTTPKEAQRILGFPPGHAYVECMKSEDSRCAVAYAKKTKETEGYPITESGVFVSEAGQRTDIQGACEILKKEGQRGLTKVKAEFGEVYVKYHRGLEKFAETPLIERSTKIEGKEVYFISGTTGLGKTSWIRETFPDLYIFCNQYSNRGKWWDGYRGQETILIDEYEGGWENTFIKMLTDQWVLNVEIKGGFVSLTAKLIFFVSNRGFRECFGDDPAIDRRIKKCIWEKLGVIPEELAKLASRRFAPR